LSLSSFFSQSAAIPAGGVFLSFYPDLDNIGGSTHPGADGYGIGRTVVDTGPAFHAGVEITEPGMCMAGTGDFFWDDANTLAEPDYHLVNLNLGLESDCKEVPILCLGAGYCKKIMG
jgi:hypothetical protein